jgi:hypothetical protein
MESTEEMITIPRAEYEALKEKLKKRMFSNPDRINAYNKAHPEKVLARAHKYINKDRDAYNARRRERYRLKKEAEAAAVANGFTAAGVCSITAAVKLPYENPGTK